MSQPPTVQREVRIKRAGFLPSLRFWPGLRRLTTVLGLAATIGTLGYSVFRFFAATPPITYIVPMVVITLALTAVSYVLLRVALEYHLVRREAIGLRAETGTLTAALESARLAFTPGRRIDFIKIIEQLNEILGIDYIYCTSLQQHSHMASARDISIAFDTYLLEILTHTTRLFTIYTSSNCAVCIKAFSSSETERVQFDHEKDGREKPLHVYTLGRDPASRFKRAPADAALPIYPYRDNAAFYYIMHELYRGGYYCNNNLRESPGSQYWNANADYHVHYNAVAVASLQSPESNTVKLPIGFLCVDNESGGFDDEACKVLLQCIASICYYSIRMTTIALTENSGE